ncbi:MAG: phage late control D family protein [Planctomycetota bacterium]|jgi:phage protein D
MTRTINPTRRIVIEGQDIGKLLADDAISLSVEDHIEEADAASFEITNRRNEWIDHPLFEQGNSVEVYLGYGKRPPKIFEGVIAVVEPHFPQDGVPTLSITAYDRSYLLRKKGDKDNAFPNRTPNELVREIARQYRFRENEIVTPDTILKKRYFQQNSKSDWAFLTEVAKDIGFELYLELGTLYFRKPQTKIEIIPGTFAYRKNLLSFEPSLSVEKPVSKVIVRGWDSILKRPFQVEVDDPYAGERDVLGEQAGSDFGGLGESVRILHDVVADNQFHAWTIAEAYFQQKEFELITATGACVGESELKAKRLIRIGGVGQKFSGLYYLTRVAHRFDDGGYICEFEGKRNAISRIAVEDKKDIERLENEGYAVRR